MTSRLATPGDVGLLPNSRRNASDREWAGSVLTRRTRRRHRAARSVAIADDDVVLPTPPLPPTNTNFRSSPSKPRADRRRESSDMKAGEGADALVLVVWRVAVAGGGTVMRKNCRIMTNYCGGQGVATRNFLRPNFSHRSLDLNFNF